MPTNALKCLALSLCLLSTAASLLATFKAGCIGDIKGGALGNPARALELENISLLFLLLSASAGGTAIGLISRSIHRIAKGVAYGLLILGGVWLASIQCEIWAVQSCLNHN